MTRRIIQMYRGTAAQNDAFTGAAGELTVDTTNNELRIHDGSTAGGHKIVNKNKNTAAGATNPIYDWVGTLAEYTAQAVATNHPDWVCFITDDDTAEAYDAYSKTQSDARYVQKAHEVIEFQAPNAGNNYTWYRKYRDGWVEQGGIVGQQGSSGTISINIPVEMANTYYTLTSGATVSDNGSTDHREGANEYISKSTTSFEKYMWSKWSSFWWKIEGMAA